MMNKKGIGGFVWTFVFLIILGLFIGGFVFDYFIDYNYEKQIGSYMENAKNTITPEAFKEQLILFKQATKDAGLTEQDYGALWFKKPDNSMVFQYQHIDSIIGRADAMIQWQQASYNNSNTNTIYSSPEAFRDVYNEKMNNLRTYLNEEGRSDWIAQDAWYVKYHPIWYCISWILLFGLLILGVAWVFFGVSLASNSDY